MSIYILLLAMILMHIEEDFCKQGVMAQMKQKRYWEENYPNKLYKNDYKMALFMHSLHWAIYIYIPVVIWFYFNGGLTDTAIMVVVLGVMFNTLIHYVIDDAKANDLTINLIQDQGMHLLQILIIWLLLQI